MLTLFRRSVTQHLMNANPPHKYRAAGTPRAATPKTFRNTPLNFRIPFVRKAVVGVFHHGHLKPRHHIRGGFTGFLKNSTIAAGVSKKVGQRRMARRFALACSYYGITFNQALSVFHKVSTAYVYTLKNRVVMLRLPLSPPRRPSPFHHRIRSLSHSPSTTTSSSRSPSSSDASWSMPSTSWLPSLPPPSDSPASHMTTLYNRPRPFARCCPDGNRHAHAPLSPPSHRHGWVCPCSHAHLDTRDTPASNPVTPTRHTHAHTPRLLLVCLSPPYPLYLLDSSSFRLPADLHPRWGPPVAHHHTTMRPYVHAVYVYTNIDGESDERIHRQYCVLTTRFVPTYRHNVWSVLTYIDTTLRHALSLRCHIVGARVRTSDDIAVSAAVMQRLECSDHSI